MGSQRAFNGIGIEWHEKSFAEEPQIVNGLEGWYIPTYGRILIVELATWNFRSVEGRRVRSATGLHGVHALVVGSDHSSQPGSMRHIP